MTIKRLVNVEKKKIVEEIYFSFLNSLLLSSKALI